MDTIVRSWIANNLMMVFAFYVANLSAVKKLSSPCSQNLLSCGQTRFAARENVNSSQPIEMHGKIYKRGIIFVGKKPTPSKTKLFSLQDVL
jgi:hypothetical protein